MKKFTRLMKTMTLAGCLVMAFAGLAHGKESVNIKTFPASSQVDCIKVDFKNRYDIKIVGDMYLPKNIDKNKRYSAIIVGPPFGGVKEQTAGLYAQELAKHGFVALAFDQAFYGESGGKPRLTVSPEMYVDDFSAAIDFLGTRKFVDRNKIGGVGICGSGGFILSAAAIDPRMQAVATVSMYDMGRQRRQGINDIVSKEQMKQNLATIAQRRWQEFDGTNPDIRPGTPAKLPENASAITQEFYAYYRTARGWHPNYQGVLYTSDAALMNFFPMQQIELISPRPVLLIAGADAHSRYFSEDAYQLAAEPKELYIVPNAGHVDLYDQMDKIPFAKLVDFFEKNL